MDMGHLLYIQNSPKPNDLKTSKKKILMGTKQLQNDCETIFPSNSKKILPYTFEINFLFMWNTTKISCKASFLSFQWFFSVSLEYNILTTTERGCLETILQKGLMGYVFDIVWKWSQNAWDDMKFPVRYLTSQYDWGKKNSISFYLRQTMKNEKKNKI